MLAERLYQCSKSVIVHDRLSSSRGVEVHRVDDTLEPWVLPSDCPNGVSERLAKAGRLQGDGRPATL